MSKLGEVQDRYLERHHIEIIEMRPGYSKLILHVHEDALNMYGTVHGGELYTLADNASGIAGFAGGHFGLVTLSGNINYLKAANSKQCIAIAQEVNSTTRTGVYDVNIYNENDVLLCKATFTYYYR